jgi:hypothetical protein
MKTPNRRRASQLALAILIGLSGTTTSTLANGSDFDLEGHRPRIATLFAGAEMPHSERIVTVGHRLFVTSDSNLFEIVKRPHGKLDKVSIASAEVILADGQTVPGGFVALSSYGHVLFATATAADSSGMPCATTLYRIELGPHEGDVVEIATAPFIGHATPFLPNGMAVDRHGDIFISNSYSTYTGEAAVIKLRVHPRPFSFQETDWLPANLGGGLPNGIQLDGDTLYLASQSALLQVHVRRDGSAGPVSTLYSADPDDFLDDLMLVPGALIVCQIDNPFAPPETSASQLTIVTRSGPTPGEVAGVIPLAGAGIHPSSVARLPGDGGRTLVVTDYLGGGLFTVAF